MTHTLLLFTNTIDRVNRAIGTTVAWLAALMALVVGLVVVLRTFFDIGSIALQESVTYMHGALFLLGMAYTAQANGHVRVDIFYRRMNTRQQAWVNACGGVLFLLPFALFLGAISWQFVLEAWRVRESSDNPGGIPALFLLKTLIPITSGLLSLHAIGEVIKQLLSLSFTLNPSA